MSSADATKASAVLGFFLRCFEGCPMLFAVVGRWLLLLLAAAAADAGSATDYHFHRAIAQDSNRDH